MYRYWVFLLLFVNLSPEWTTVSALPRHASWHFEGEFGDYILHLLTRLDQLVKDAEENQPGMVHVREQVLFDHYKARYPACTWAPRTLLKRANEHRLKFNQRHPTLPWTEEEVLLRNCYEGALQLMNNNEAGGKV